MDLKSVKAPKSGTPENSEENSATRENSQASADLDVTASTVLRIRASKADSAYLYSIFESYEGLCAYSTLEHRAEDHHRDIEMIVPLAQEPALRKLLATLKEELGGELHELRIE